jgi:hypothetical protein
MRVSSIFKRLFLLGLLVVLIGLYLFWSYLYPPIPESLRQTLFEGVGYIRDVRHTPRPVIIHVVSVDLDNKNIRFLVTPGEAVEEGEIGARTTSQFLAEIFPTTFYDCNGFGGWP